MRCVVDPVLLTYGGNTALLFVIYWVLVAMLFSSICRSSHYSNTRISLLPIFCHFLEFYLCFRLTSKHFQTIGFFFSFFIYETRNGYFILYLYTCISQCELYHFIYRDEIILCAIYCVKSDLLESRFDIPSLLSWLALLVMKEN